MTQTVANVTAGSPVVTGGILTGPLGSSLPTDATSAVDVAIVPLGYAGDSGLEPTGDEESREDIKAWGADVVASLVTDKATRKFSFSLIEVFNADVAKTVFGSGNVTVTPATISTGTKIAITDKADSLDAAVWVFDMKYQGKRMRLVCPNATLSVTERPWVDEDLGGYDCEITCLPDSSGVRVYRYYQNDDATGSSSSSSSSSS